MTTKRTTTIAVTAVLLVVVAVVTGYLLYAVPSSDADRLSRQVAGLRSEQTTLVRKLTAAQRRLVVARKQADQATAQAYAKGRVKGLAEAGTSYDRGYADGQSAGQSSAMGAFGDNWTNGAFYVIRMLAGADGRAERIAARAALQQCLAVYAQSGSVWVQGPAC
jgi:hypothetical protein